MRFLVSPSSDALARTRPPVRAFLVFAALALAGLAVQRGLNGGFTAQGVLDYYLGGGVDPLPATALWEEVHTGAFLYGFTLLMLGSLLVVTPIAPRRRAWLFWPAFAATLADLVAPFAILRLGRAGGLRVATFTAALATLAALLVAVAISYGRPAGRAR
jgi:hypothetical protein